MSIIDTNIVPLHKNVQYIDQAVLVLNEEWPISNGARKHMLESSNDEFPYSLVLLENNNKESHVIGHSRIVRVQGQQCACFVQSVIIRKNRRGKGYGKTLMQKTEEHAKKLGLQTVYLTTHDKQDFYSHVGYKFCKPVNFSSSKLIAGTIWERMGQVKGDELASFESTCNDQQAQGITATSEMDGKDASKNSIKDNNSAQYSTDIQPPAPPPMPPPPPPQLNKSKVLNKDKPKTYWMKKELLT